jgi:hypothetical protein
MLDLHSVSLIFRLWCCLFSGYWKLGGRVIMPAVDGFACHNFWLFDVSGCVDWLVLADWLDVVSSAKRCAGLLFCE